MLIEAGFTPNIIVKDKEKILKQVKDLSEKLGKSPGPTEFKNEYGYDDNRSKARIDYIKLKADIKKLYSEKGKMKQIDLIKELKKRELASIDTVKTAFKVSSIFDLYDILDNKKRG